MVKVVKPLCWDKNFDPKAFSAPALGLYTLEKTARPMEAKFHVKPLWVGETKVYSGHLGHMTKMAATPIYGKNPSKIFFSGTKGPMTLGLGP